jgi:hypothetical protein
VHIRYVCIAHDAYTGHLPKEEHVRESKTYSTFDEKRSMIQSYS